MSSRLAPYLPRLAAEWEIDAPGARWREIDGTCCFVDISGFTALSERLGRRGRIGAEELTEVLDHVFARMLTVAYEKGGSLLKFGGDALLILFVERDHARLAVEAAVAMRAALREARTLPTSVGRVNLRMSVGVHTGRFHVFRVGTVHRELIVAGPAATETTLMEQAADAGEIVLSASTAASMPSGAVGAAKRGGHLLRWRRLVSGGPGARPARSVPDSALVSAVPVGLRRHLLEGSGESEHRVASVGFVKFMGIDDYLAAHGADATAAALDAIVTDVQRAAETEAVTILASDIDANGGKLILVSGLPTALEDDEGRMLRTARAVLDQDHALDVKIGLNRGHVFAGDIGAEFRRTFTVMGDTVNLAARLMAAAAPGELYATAEILARSRSAFATRTLEPFFVKGKEQPVQAYAVGEPTGSQRGERVALPFVGRDAELEQLRAADLAARSGRGAVVEIRGARGAGKSRLLDEFIAGGRSPTLYARGEAYGSSTAFLALRAPLRAMFCGNSTDPAECARLVVAAVAKRAPSRRPLAPLLAPVLDVELAPTAESAAIAPEFRRDRLADLIVELMGAAEEPLLFVVDDAHWVDDASAAVLGRLFDATRDHAWLAVAARRPEDGGFRPERTDIPVVLGPIEDPIARAMIDEVTTGTPLRPQQRDRIVERAAGNPLFIEELLRHTRTSGFEALPETLDAVAMREIDALPPLARRIVRYASVLGRRFEAPLLEELLRDDTFDRDATKVAMEALSAHLLPRDGAFEFRHAVLQEAAYESLPFRRRVGLHRRAGSAILASAGIDRDAAEALLSLHLFLGQDWERAWTWARRAGLSAVAALAPAEAVLHLERAVVAARRRGDVPDDELSEVLVELGEALVTTGLHDKADDAYRRAAASASRPVERARILDRRAYVRGECQGAIGPAIRHVRAGIALLDASPASDPDVASARAQLLAREASFRLMQGRLREAEALSRTAMARAREVEDRRAEARAMTVLDVCLMESGRPDEARHLPRVLEIYEELHDHERQAATLNNLGGVAFWKSEWPLAAAYYTRAAEAAGTAGDLATAALAEANLGEVLVDQGRLDEAVALLVRAVRTLDSYGNVILAAQSRMWLGRARVFLGDVAGLELLETARATFDDLHVSVLAVEVRAILAEVHAHAGRLAEARTVVEDARSIARDIGDAPVTVGLDRVDATIRLRAGEAGAAEALDRALTRAREHRARYDELMLLELGRRAGRPIDADALAALESTLGVVGYAALAGSDRSATGR